MTTCRISSFDKSLCWTENGFQGQDGAQGTSEWAFIVNRLWWMQLGPAGCPSPTSTSPPRCCFLQRMLALGSEGSRGLIF